jgi:ankyrin repeat protein
VERADRVYGLTALHLAAIYGRVALLTVLLEGGGAVVNALNMEGRTACQLAEEYKEMAALDLLNVW